MSKMSQEEKLFRNESTILEYYQGMSVKDNTPEETKEALEQLTRKYKSLLDQTRFLTWISGRLERKLQRSNRELYEKNSSLQKALDDLTRAEAGRSAYAIIYFIAIVLFVLEEFFVEPLIGVFGESIGYSILIKLVIVLVLKVSESSIESKIRHARTRLKRKRESFGERAVV
jgi:chromosome segregation ATPase